MADFISRNNRKQNSGPIKKQRIAFTESDV